MSTVQPGPNSASPSSRAASHDFLARGGELGKLIAGYDWSATGIGAVSEWPPSLKTTLSVILQAPVAMAILLGEDGIMIYNDAFAAFAEGRHPAALGAKVRIGWPEVAAFSDHVLRTVLDGEALTYRDHELTLNHRGSLEPVWLNLDFSPILDDAGRPVAVLAVIVETTEKVRAERWLKGEDERLRHMFEQAPGFIAMVKGPEHVFDLVNPAYLQLVGHRDVLNKPVRDALPEIAEQGFLELLDDVYTSGEAFSATAMPITLQRVPGAPVEQRHLDFVYQPMKGVDNRVIGIFVQGTDVTRRIRAEADARESNAQFRTFAHAMPNHVWTASPAGLLDWFSERVYADSGFAPGELDGDRWTEIMHPDDRSKASDAWAAAVASGTTYEIEFRIKRFDGSFRWHLVRALPVRDTSGAIVRWIGTNTDIHARRVLEAEQTRDRNRLWELSQDLMLVCDFTGKTTAINPSVTRMLGWAESEILEHPILMFVHPDDVGTTEAELAKLAQGKTTLAFENRLRTKDGDYRLMAWTAVPDDTRIHAVGRDITRERAMTRDRERIWTLSPVLKVVSEPNGVILAVNPTWTRVLGWLAEETIGRTMADFERPEEGKVAAVGLNRFAGGVLLTESQRTFATKAGARRRIAWTIVPEDGRLYAFGRDVTAEVEAAEALVTSQVERERIWNSTNDLMGTAGLDGFLRSANPAWTRLLGQPEEHLLSHRLTDFVDPDDRAKADSTIERLTAGASVADHEYRLVRKDGGASLIAWSAERVGDAFYMVGRDVTEQRAAEAGLRQAQKMEAVGQLTGGIAHDFNNLLQGITGSLDLVQKRIGQGRVDELDRYVAGAMTAAKRAAALTHRLLAFSRRQPLSPRAVRANPLLASMEDLLRRTLGERIDLELVLAGGLWLTLCDPNQLENAVLNLAINARDAMPDGGKLTIETCYTHLDRAYTATQRDVRPGQYVCLCVTDTGTGMSAETIVKAFEPFFTTKPFGQGTGLGLSMIYGFARQSEGHARIYSELGKGTTFKLYLPRYRGKSEEDDSPPDLTEDHGAEAGDTVLVVEDEAIVRSLIVEVLRELGYEALEAADGPAGLALLQSAKRIDLLVTDMGLPGLNGRQVADAGRALRPELKVLFMTGYAENAALASGFLEPGMTMITKPFAMEALATRIRGMIEGES